MALVNDFKDALASWATGVSVVATRCGDLVYGLTVSSFTSLSLDPPLVLVCVANRNRLPGMIRDAGSFSVSLLGAEQTEASSYFAKSGREPSTAFCEQGEHRCRKGMPIVPDAMAFVSCDLHSEMIVGDHTILVGQVVEAAARPDCEPLLYHRRRYRALTL
jgi:3-hydroxy-9,10-secoandrosta-1,3,5(10)-triene-9,17-dione monooxygenase reductase component